MTVSLVEQARGGPFVYWGDLATACAKASAAGFDAVELFVPSADAVSVKALRELLQEHALKLSAIGSGAGWVLHRLHLCDPDGDRRQRARQFIGELIEFGAQFAAPVIVGSMQGRCSGQVSRRQAMAWLAEGLEELGGRAAGRRVPVLLEPLNRYETDLVNTQADGVALLDCLQTDSVRLLADLFHMNIEERSIAAGLRVGGRLIGHVHFVDSNRRPAGGGHIDFAGVARTLREIGYDGYVSAEALPYPDSDAAAAQTIQLVRQHRLGGRCLSGRS